MGLRLVPIGGGEPIIASMVIMAMFHCHPDRLLEHNRILNMIPVIADLSFPVILAAQNQAVPGRAVFLGRTPPYLHNPPCLYRGWKETVRRQ